MVRSQMLEGTLLIRPLEYYGLLTAGNFELGQEDGVMPRNDLVLLCALGARSLYRPPFRILLLWPSRDLQNYGRVRSRQMLSDKRVFRRRRVKRSTIQMITTLSLRRSGSP